MSWSDPVGDMLTRIRNGSMVGTDVVDVPHSKLKCEMARVLKREGYIADYAVEGGVKKVLRIYLKYAQDREPAIRGLRRDSKPGLRKYATCTELPRVLSGMGIAVLSTSQGIVTDKEARKRKIGGELLCRVW